MLEDVYFSTEYMYSEFQLLACPFCFFAFLSHSVAVAAWSGIQLVDPQMIHFELFYQPVRKGQFNPQTIIVYFRKLEKIYFGHSSKKDNHSGLLPQQDFVLLYKFETSWALLGRLSRGLFTISGASNFKHFKQLFMTLSGLGLLTNVRAFSLSLLFLYLAAFKTVMDNRKTG